MSDLVKSRFWAVQLHILRAIRAGSLAAAPDVWAARGASRAEGEVAVIPIMGVLTQRGSWYGMSLESIRASLRNRLADSGTRAIVLEFDSPGGEVFGIDELATEIRNARGVKPIVAVANPLAASAAAWLAAQADELLVTPSGEVGSVGVYATHVDLSRALDQAGITVTLVSAGAGKTSGNTFEPLSEEARAETQADVDRYYSMFARAMAKGRGVTVDTVRSDWKAKMYGAKDAVANGLATAVGTLEDAVRRASALSTELRGTAAAVDLEVETRRRARAR